MNISTNKIDLAVSITKGFAGIVPGFGSLIGEVIGVTIPNQRIDRLSKFVQILDAKFADMEKEILNTKFQTSGYIDLFEDSFYQAARALYDERLELIATILKNGLSEAGSDYAKYKHVLSLLSEINEVEILLLKYYSLDTIKSRQDFYDAHFETLNRPPITMTATTEDIEKDILMSSYDNHLIRLGLVDVEYQHLRRDETPEFDTKTGMMKASRYAISRLGQLLLDNIGETDTP